MRYTEQLRQEIVNRKKELVNNFKKLEDLKREITSQEKRLHLIEGSSSVKLVVQILDSNKLTPSLFLDYDKTFRIVTQDEKLIPKLDKVFGELDKEKQRISHSFRY